MSSVFATSLFPKRKTKTRACMQNPDEKMAQLKSLLRRKENDTHQVLQLASLKKKIDQHKGVVGYWFGYNLSCNRLHVREGGFLPTLGNAKPSPTPSLQLCSAGGGAGCPAQIWGRKRSLGGPSPARGPAAGHSHPACTTAAVIHPQPQTPSSMIFNFLILKFALSFFPHPPTTFWFTSHFKNENEKKPHHPVQTL